jgi:hypothetical protein
VTIKFHYRLETEKDFRGLGVKLEKVINKIKDLPFGFYQIKDEDKYLFIILEGMNSFQESINNYLVLGKKQRFA